jgi:hypothetical protein
MSVTRDQLHESIGQDPTSAFSPLSDIVGELRELVRSHVDTIGLVIEATSVRLLFAVVLTITAALSFVLGWALAVGIALYYLAVSTSPIAAGAVGVIVHAVIAVALLRRARGELSRVRAYFNAARYETAQVLSSNRIG